MPVMLPGFRSVVPLFPAITYGFDGLALAKMWKSVGIFLGARPRWDDETGTRGARWSKVKAKSYGRMDEAEKRLWEEVR